MDLQQQGVTVLLELDKEARAHQVERQHRAILKFAGFCRAFPIPNLVNSAILKLADYWKIGNNLLRQSILKVFKQIQSSIKLIDKPDQVLKPLIHVLSSNDPIARSLTMRLIGHLSEIASDKIELYHRIHTFLESPDRMELQAGIFTTQRFCSTSSAFAADICDKLADLAQENRSSPGLCSQLIRLYQKMTANSSLVLKAHGECMKLAKLDFNYISNSCNNVNNSSNTANEEEIVLSVLQSSTILAINSPILKKDQIELLLSHIRINQSNSSCSDAMMMDVDGEAKTEYIIHGALGCLLSLSIHYASAFPTSILNNLLLLLDQYRNNIDLMRSITDLIFRLCKTDLFCIRWHRSCLSKEPVQHHDGMKNPVLRPAMDQLMLHWIIETGSTSHLDSTIPLNMAKAVGMLFKSHPAVIQSLLKKILQQVLSTATSTGGSASKSSNTCIKAFILISKMNYNKASKDALPPTYILDQILQTDLVSPALKSTAANAALSGVYGECSAYTLAAILQHCGGQEKYGTRKSKAIVELVCRSSEHSRLDDVDTIKQSYTQALSVIEGGDSAGWDMYEVATRLMRQGFYSHPIIFLKNIKNMIESETCSFWITVLQNYSLAENIMHKETPPNGTSSNLLSGLKLWLDEKKIFILSALTSLRALEETGRVGSFQSNYLRLRLSMFKCFGLIASHLLQPSAYRQQKCKSSLDLLIAEIDLFVVSFLRLTSDTLAIIELALSTALLLRFLVRDDPSWSDPRLLNLLYFEKESLLEDIQHDGIVQLRGKILGYIKTSINKSGYGSSPGQLSEAVLNLFKDLATLPLPAPCQFFIMKTDAVNLKYEKVGGSGTSGSLVLRVNVVFDFVDDKAQLETSQIASVDVGIVNADGKNLCRTSCRLGTSLDSLEDVVLVIDLANASQSKLEVKIYDQMGNIAPPNRFKMSDFVQLQLNEVEALKAIYQEDFGESEREAGGGATPATAGATGKGSPWKVVPRAPEAKTYQIHLRPTIEELRGPVAVFLQFRFYKRYPDIVPELKIIKDRGVSDLQIAELQRIILAKAKELVGAEMIFEIASFIEEHLSIHNSAIRGVKQVSAYEEMVDRQRETAQEEKIRAQQELSKQRKEEEELQQMNDNELALKIVEEIERKKARVDELKSEGNMLDRDLDPSASSSLSSSSVGLIWQLFPTGVTDFAIGSFIRQEGIYTDSFSFIGDGQSFLARRVIITNEFYRTKEGNQKLRSLYPDFSSMINLRHPNVSLILGCQLSDQSPSKGFSLVVIEEHRQTTLLEILRRSGCIQFTKARDHMKQLINALAFLHSSNIIHKSINVKNVFFSEDAIKLGGLYEFSLTDLDKLKKFNEGQLEPKRKFKYWISPEAHSDLFQGSKKDDVWSLGATFILMVFGLDIVKKHSDLLDFVNSNDEEIPNSFKSLILSMCHSDSSKRPGLHELLRHEFFTDTTRTITNLPLALKVASQAAVSPSVSARNEVSRAVASSTNPVMKFAQQDSFMNMGSRYETDFDELEFLGKGGFGSVVKVRNKIDDHFYAVKKVKIHPKDKDKGKLIREVLALSRLHHEYVVRYFTAWVESKDSINLAEEFTDEDDIDDSASEEEEEDDDDDDEDNGLDDWMTSGRKTDTSFISFQHTPSTSNVRRLSTTTYLSETDPTDTGAISDESGTTLGIRWLYIQMEYCEKKSLRDVIDEGLEAEQAWRLFRQLLEGLAYVHSQGMIHRDLKPSNVFLSADGNVKLGDFGLAAMKSDMAPPRVFPGSEIQDESLTSDIGTPVYCAPETIISGKYNSKVDMFSLGIIFFEMVYSFSTAMQRFVVLRDIRRLIFPKDFDSKKYVNQQQIITSLLKENPKDRPSTQELLRSKLLPPKYEEQELVEAFRTIVNPENVAYYTKLVNALFTYTTDKHQDFAYDYNSNATGAFSSVDYFETVVSTRIISQVSSILEKHAAIMLSAPLFSPKLSHNIHRGVNVLDSSGTIVQLPHDLTFPWCRFISRVSPMPAHLKRYAIDRVFRVNPAGGQPRSVLECDFDIVTRSDTDHHGFVPDAEVVSTLCQIIDQFPSNLGKSSEFDLIINHCDVLDAILDFSGAPKDEESRSIVYRILEQERASLNTRSTMLQRLGLDRAISDKLVLFDFGGKSTMDFSTAVARLQTLLKDSSAASALISKPIKQMEILVRNLKLMGTRCKIVFSPLLSYHMDYYKGSLVFQLGKREKQKIDLIAAGGRYDFALASMKNPFSGSRERLQGVGFNLAIQKIIHKVSIEEKKLVKGIAFQSVNDDLPNLETLLGRRSDVLVATIGKSSSSNNNNGSASGILQRLNIATELWNSGLSAEYSLEEKFQTSQDVIKSAAVDGKLIAITLKERQGPMSIKVRNLVTKTETEVSRIEIIDQVKSELESIKTHSSSVSGGGGSGGNGGGDFSESDFSKSASDSSVTIIYPPSMKSKIKSKQKIQARERATTAVANILKTISKATIFAVDLDVSLLKRTFLGCADVSVDELWKSSISSASSSQKEYLSEVRDHVKKANRDGVRSSIWIFSTNDNSAFLVSV